MISTIKKLHELQLMAFGNERISISVDYFNVHEPYWSLTVCYWFGNDIKERIDINSYSDSAEHRIDMMLKYRILEK